MIAYYGIQRSSEYLAHYGVKGMKWGVRKALEKGDKFRLKYHHDRAIGKLRRLQEKANIAEQKLERRGGIDAASLGAAIAGASVLNKKITPQKNHFNDLLTIYGVGGTALTGAGIYNAMSAHHRMGTKGHAKAIKKVNDWQDAMHEAFKDTKYEKRKRRPFNDTYKVIDYGDYRSEKGKTLMSIPGSHLTRDYKGSDKQTFLNKLKDTESGYITPSYRKSKIDDGSVSARDYFGPIRYDRYKKKRRHV